MRTGLAAILVILGADITPREGVFETRWAAGDFVEVATEKLDRAVLEGSVVGLKISGRGESCLLRKRRYPLRLPCRFQFRLRWSDAKYGAAYPSVHLLFNPPEAGSDWWKRPNDGGNWNVERDTFIFHFSTDPAWQVLGPTRSLEAAVDRHGYSAPENTWVRIDIEIDGQRAIVSVDGQEVARTPLHLKDATSFTYAIGDQTSTFVELDEFRLVRR